MIVFVESSVFPNAGYFPLINAYSYPQNLHLEIIFNSSDVYYRNRNIWFYFIRNINIIKT